MSRRTIPERCAESSVRAQAEENRLGVGKNILANGRPSANKLQERERLIHERFMFFFVEAKLLFGDMPAAFGLVKRKRRPRIGLIVGELTPGFLGVGETLHVAEIDNRATREIAEQKNIIAVYNDGLPVVESGIIVKMAGRVAVDVACENPIPLKIDIAKRPPAQSELRFPSVAERDLPNAFSSGLRDQAFVGNVRLPLGIFIIESGRKDGRNAGTHRRGDANSGLQQERSDWTGPCGIRRFRRDRNYSDDGRGTDHVVKQSRTK